MLPSAGWRGPLFIILPAATLALRPIAYFTRLTRETISGAATLTATFGKRVTIGAALEASVVNLEWSFWQYHGVGACPQVPAPGAPVQKSKAVEVDTLGCSGLCLITDVKGDMMGMPFEGHGVSTWDPAKKKYVGSWTMKDGTELCIRPIRPEDEPLLVKFHGTLSERSVALRYFHAMKLTARVAHDRLTRICFIDYDREMALVAEDSNPIEGGPRVLGVGRISKLRGTREARFSILIGDPFQGKGLGTEIVRRLIAVARAEGVERITSSMAPENAGILRVCEKLGFQRVPSREAADDGLVHVEYKM